LIDNSVFQYRFKNGNNHSKVIIRHPGYGKWQPTSIYGIQTRFFKLEYSIRYDLTFAKYFLSGSGNQWRIKDKKTGFQLKKLE